MKNILNTFALFAILLIGLNVGASTNSVATNGPTLVFPDVPSAGEIEAAKMPMEFTLGGSGITIPKTGETSFGLNFSLSAQPLKQPIWFGISQEVSWEPSFAGATDLYADWATPLIKDKLYLNTGWSVGALYDKSTVGWRSGPEVSLEYYTSGNAFIIVGANYDLVTKSSGASWEVGAKDSGIRYFIGIGFTL